MADISKINAVLLANIAEIDDVLAANIAKVNGLVFSATVGASAAFSVRLLNSLLGVTYNGAAMRVRRETVGGTGDDDEADIGFDSGVISLDSAISNASAGVTATTLGQFINVGTVGGTTYTNPDSLTGTASCVTVEWKDQSGQGNDASQATQAKQPTIHEGSANTDLVQDNGKPAVKFDGSANQALRTSSYAVELSQNNASIFTVHNSNGVGNKGYVVAEADSSSPYSSNFIYGTFTGPAILWVNATTFGTAQTGQVLSGFDYDGTNFQAYLNMASSGSSGTATVNSEVNSYTYIGSQAQDGSSFSFTGNIQEIVTFQVNKSADRSTFEENINGHYLIGNFPNPTSGLLYDYSGAAAAYSVRQLANTAALAMRIREDGTDTETDIGFDSNGDLDTAAIASHCGSNNGYVVTWYDQAGSQVDATQGTSGSQPQIYNGTAVITENGKAAIEWDGSDDGLAHTFASASTLFRTNTTAFIVNTVESTPQRRPMITCDPTSTDIYTPYLEYRSGPEQVRYFTGNAGNFTLTVGTGATTGTQNLISLLKDATTSQTIYVDGSSIATTASSSNATVTMDGLVLGSWYAGGRHYHGTMQEIIMWDSHESSNRTGIETNINNYFSIY